MRSYNNVERKRSQALRVVSTLPTGTLYVDFYFSCVKRKSRSKTLIRGSLISLGTRTARLDPEMYRSSVRTKSLGTTIARLPSLNNLRVCIQVSTRRTMPWLTVLTYQFKCYPVASPFIVRKQQGGHLNKHLWSSWTE